MDPPLEKEPIHFLHKFAHLSTILEVRIYNLGNNAFDCK